MEKVYILTSYYKNRPPINGYADCLIAVFKNIKDAEQMRDHMMFKRDDIDYCNLQEHDLLYFCPINTTF